MNGSQYLVGLDGLQDVTPQAGMLTNPPDWFIESLGSASADSGVKVNATSALSHGPLWQGLNILAGDLGQLPFHKMLRRGRNTEKDRMHPIERMFQDGPNEFQIPSVWKEFMMLSALLWGNGVSEIVRDRTGQVVELIPLPPDKLGFDMDDQMRATYIVWIDGKPVGIRQENAFHIMGLANNGVWGYSLVDVAKNVLGLGIGLQRHGSAVFKNAARPSGVLTHPAHLTPEARRNLRREWTEIHAGVDNAARIAILQEAMDFKPMSVSNEDAQWLDAMRFDREMVASLLNLPAFKLNALENSSVRANLEEQNRDYFNTSLSRWLNRFAEEARRKLLSRVERKSGRHFFRWFPEAFLKGNVQQRFAAYSVGIQSRILSPNEAREKEDMNPYEGGDEFANPNIDPRPDSNGNGNQEPPEAPTPEQEEAAQNLVSEHVRHLLSVESARVKRAAKQSKNFIGWLDGFYDSYGELAQNVLGSTCRMLSVMGQHCVLDDAAARHAERSKDQLITVAGCVTRDDLPDAVTVVCDEIQEQHATFTESLLS